jgi:hypothetical protein
VSSSFSTFNLFLLLLLPAILSMFEYSTNLFKIYQRSTRFIYNMCVPRIGWCVPGVRCQLVHTCVHTPAPRTHVHTSCHSLHHCQPSFYGWSIKANNFCSYNSSSSVNSPESTMVTCMLGVPLCDPTCSIFLMVDIPSFNTRPKTTCLPSNQLVSAVQMKN